MAVKAYKKNLNLNEIEVEKESIKIRPKIEQSYIHKPLSKINKNLKFEPFEALPG
jgi:hypothetical protein